MNPEPDQSTSSAERRKDDRLPAQGQIVVRLDGQDLQGLAENVSKSGVLFFSNEPIQVVVEFNDGEETVRRTGRIVRSQRLSARKVGYAVEFEGE